MACHTSQQELLTGQGISPLTVLRKELETDADVVAAAVDVAVAAAVAGAASAAAAVTWLSS